MQSYSQRDPNWSSQTLGKSGLTIGRYGCTTTCISDLSTYFGDNLIPPQVASRLQYTNQGLIIWGTCKFGHFTFERREFGRNDSNIKQALADPNRAVILNVANGSHWVVATGIELLTKMYKIADPWQGDRTTMRRYGNNITGAAYFRRSG